MLAVLFDWCLFFSAENDKEDEASTPEKESEDILEEELPTKRGRGKAATVPKKGRKGKNEAKPESTVEKPVTEESPKKDDDEDIVEDVEVPKTKSRRKPAAKEKPVPEPSTRSIRARKHVTYGEPKEEEEEDDTEDPTVKKTKKAGPKKAPAKKTKENVKAGAAPKRRGRVAKNSQKEEKGKLRVF